MAWIANDELERLKAEADMAELWADAGPRRCRHTELRRDDVMDGDGMAPPAGEKGRG